MSNAVTRRYLNPLLVALVLLLLLAPAVSLMCWRFMPGKPGVHVNANAAGKIRVGMTQKQVESLFRVPPGDYFEGPDDGRPQASANRRPDLRRADWIGQEFQAAVYFGPDERVADFELCITTSRRMTVQDRIQKWMYWIFW
jgi:hypothetical protein